MNRISNRSSMSDRVLEAPIAILRRQIHRKGFKHFHTHSGGRGTQKSGSHSMLLCAKIGYSECSIRPDQPLESFSRFLSLSFESKAFLIQTVLCQAHIMSRNGICSPWLVRLCDEQASCSLQKLYNLPVKWLKKTSERQKLYPSSRLRMIKKRFPLKTERSFSCW